MMTTPGPAHTVPAAGARGDAASRAQALVDALWDELGLSAATASEHLLDGAYGNLLSVAEERSREAHSHVPLTELLAAVRVLRGRHLALSVSQVGA